MISYNICLSLFDLTSLSIIISRSIHVAANGMILFLFISSVISVTQPCPTLCDPMDCSMPGFPVHCQPLELAQTHVHWVGDATQPPHPLSSPSPPALNLSQHQGLIQWLSSSHQVAKEFVLPMKIQDWSDLAWTGFLLAVQGTLKSLLQHHNSEASILQCSAFFTVQLYHPYVTTGKTVALTRCTVLWMSSIPLYLCM